MNPSNRLRLRSLAAAPLMALAVSACAQKASYDIRSQVSAGLASASEAKILVTEAFLDTGKWPASSDAVSFAQRAGDAAQVSIGPGGVISIVFSEPKSLAGKRLLLQPREGASPGMIEWTCSSPDIDVAHMPASCR